MYESVWNANCKTENCRGHILIAPALAPNERREKPCRICGERHEFSAEDVYDFGTKLETRIGRY